MAAIPMFNLPVLSTQYEKIQPIPTSNWMTALGQGLEAVGEPRKNVADAKRIQEMNKKKKDLEAMLNSAKNDDEKLAELQKKLDDLKAELMLAENISGVFEIRFRQGEYSVKSEFPVSSISVAGIQYPLEKNLNSKIFVDGLKLSLGIAYNF